MAASLGVAAVSASQMATVNAREAGMWCMSVACRSLPGRGPHQSGERGAVRGTCLHEQSLDVLLDGARREVERSRDVAVGMALRDQPEDFELACSDADRAQLIRYAVHRRGPAGQRH